MPPAGTSGSRWKGTEAEVRGVAGVSRRFTPSPSAQAKPSRAGQSSAPCHEPCHAKHRSISASFVVTPYSGPTSRLQEARPRTPCALAAPMALVIALTEPAALGLSAAPFHEPFHADGRHRPLP